MPKLAWDSAGHMTRAIPQPELRVGLSLAHLGSHAQPHTNQKISGWPGLGHVLAPEIGAWPPEQQELDSGGDMAWRGYPLTSGAPGI